LTTAGAVHSIACESEPLFKFYAMRRTREEPAAAAEAAAVAQASRGVRSAKQLRSQRKHDALLQAGRALLDGGDLASISVSQLTRAAGMAVGSFYSRFADKDAWFGELVRVTGEAVLHDTRTLLSSARFQRAPDARKVGLIVRHIVAIHRHHRGIFRAALNDGARPSRYAAPVRDYGQQLGAAVQQALAARLLKVPHPQRRLRVGIALQIVYGTLVNAVLRDPGPIRLDDGRMERELTRVFLDCVRLG